MFDGFDESVFALLVDFVLLGYLLVLVENLFGFLGFFLLDLARVLFE